MKDQVKEFQNDKHKEKILDRIQKLLNVANGTQYEAEADTAMKMAQNYMKSYGLSLTDVELANELLEEIIEIPIKGHCKMKNPERWAKILSVAIGVVFDCRVYQKNSGFNASHMVFVGYAKDAEFAKLIYSTMYISIRAAACHEFPKGAGKTRLSFMYGVASRLLERAHEEKVVAKKEPSGRYEMVVVEKDKRVKDYMEENLDLVNTKARRMSIDSNAYKSGRKHANKMDLMNKEKVQSKPTLALSHG